VWRGCAAVQNSSRSSSSSRAGDCKITNTSLVVAVCTHNGTTAATSRNCNCICWQAAGDLHRRLLLLLLLFREGSWSAASKDPPTDGPALKDDPPALRSAEVDLVRVLHVAAKAAQG